MHSYHSGSLLLVNRRAESTRNSPMTPTPFTAHIGTADGAAGRLEDVPEGNAFRFTFNTGPCGMEPEMSSTHLLLSQTQAEAKLRSAERSSCQAGPSSLVSRIDQNYLPAKGKGEDRTVISSLTKQNMIALARVKSHAVWEEWTRMKRGSNDSADGAGESGDAGAHEQRGAVILASVFDGHGGSPALVDVAEKTFHQCVAWTLGQVFKGGSVVDERSAEDHSASRLGGANNGNTSKADGAIVQALIEA